MPLTSWEVASRLSYFLTGSIPDAELAAAADAGKLRRPTMGRPGAATAGAAARADAAGRMHQQWLGTERSALAKDDKAFPKFTPLTAYYFAKESDTFMRNVLFEPAGSFSDLMLANYTFANTPLAEYYGVAAPATDWDRVELDPAAALGDADPGGAAGDDGQAGPHRPGAARQVRARAILCRSIPPPSPEIVAMFKPLDLSKTAREQFTQHAADPKCATCHKYSIRSGCRSSTTTPRAVARRRPRHGHRRDRGASTGTRSTASPGLAQLLVDMPEARACYVEPVAAVLVGQAAVDADKANVDWLMTQLLADDQRRRPGGRDGAERQLPLSARTRRWCPGGRTP